MWYFAWILGVLLACAFGIINVLWLEAQESLDQDTAVLDPLTKLPTRVEFLERLEEILGHHAYGADRQSFSLLLISLDRFRMIREKGEDEAVDGLVLRMAELIRRAIRQETDILARYDAATFALILPGAEKPAAQNIAERICRDAADCPDPDKEGSVVSVGIVEYPASLGEAPVGDIWARVRALLEAGDEAVKKARQEGENRFCCA